MSLDTAIQTRTQTCACTTEFEQQGISVGEKMIWHPWRCPACQDRMDTQDRKTRAAEPERVREAKVVSAVTALGIPPIYADVALETFTLHGPPRDREAQGRMLQLMRRYLAGWPQVDSLLVFRGEPGTGKGHVAWSLAKAIAAGEAARVKVVKLADLIRQIRASWRDPDALAEDKVLALYRDLDLLVIDEVSRHAFYGQQIHQHLYDVVDHRIEHCRPTILTTNEDDAGLCDTLRPALVDRLQGSGGIVEFGAASWRNRPRESGMEPGRMEPGRMEVVA